MFGLNPELIPSCHTASLNKMYIFATLCTKCIKSFLNINLRRLGKKAL
jgi:hypothetical protein